MTRLYFYDLPRVIQLAVLSDISYEDVAHAECIDNRYIVTTKSKTELVYNDDGTKWHDMMFWDEIGWEPPA